MEVTKAKNTGKLSGFEQMHLPWIQVPEFIKKGDKFDVLVKVGRASHPMDKDHYIRCIRLYINDVQYECRILKSGNLAEAKFKISLGKDSIIRAWAECNLHGVWEDEAKVILYLGNG